jgi:putative Mg2+ transporter-C (MgtC) family protein
MGSYCLGHPAVLRGDPGRIAAQAITSIGFLGAGAILRYEESIRGLTTAACMRVVCAIGLWVGAGFYLFGIAVSALAQVSLIGLKRWEKISQDWYREMVVISEDIGGQVERIQAVIDKYDSKVTRFGVAGNLQEKEITGEFPPPISSHPPRPKNVR